jgi:hypothetical protein
MTNHDDELLAFTVATVWREERVSCPHPDILQAYDTGSLSPGAMEFLEFHLQESACPYCDSVLQDLRSRQQDADETRMTDLKDRLMRSTVSELRRVSGA